jgi:hypothetical protein
MAYTNIYNLRYNTTSVLKAKVTVALAKAAFDILNEDPATNNHAQRIKWARRTLTSDTRLIADEVMWAVLSNATIAAAGDAALDTDVQFVVNGLVDNFSVGL